MCLPREQTIWTNTRTSGCTPEGCQMSRHEQRSNTATLNTTQRVVCIEEAPQAPAQGNGHGCSPAQAWGSGDQLGWKSHSNRDEGDPTQHDRPREGREGGGVHEEGEGKRPYPTRSPRLSTPESNRKMLSLKWPTQIPRPKCTLSLQGEGRTALSGRPWHPCPWYSRSAGRAMCLSRGAC